MASVFKRNGKGKYYIAFDEVSEKGRKRRVVSSGTTDKRSAQQIANRLEAENALRERGVIDVRQEKLSKQASELVATHLKSFRTFLVSKGNTQSHIDRSVQCVQLVAEFAGWIRLRDISADGLHRYAQHLAVEHSRASRTIQAHITACKSFTIWLTRHHKIPADPLSSVSRPNPNSNRKRRRRMLLPDEWKWIMQSLEHAPVRYGITAHERLLLYDTAIQTGYRNTELRKLTRSSLVCHGKPMLVLTSSNTKNRKNAKQYIRQDLSDKLNALLRKDHVRRTMFVMPDRTECAQMLRDDLAFAREYWLNTLPEAEQQKIKDNEVDFLAATNRDGEVLDFHSLRHTCGAWLAMASVPPKVVQTVMRHATITLTMDTYGHLFPDQEASAVEMQAQLLD